MHAEELAVRIYPDPHFFPVLVHYRVVAFFALAGLLCDAKNLIASGFLFDSGLRRRWHVFHVYRSFILRLNCQSEEKAGAGAYYSD